MEQRRIKLADIEQNEGQIEGLPHNPRQWTRADLNKLKKSLQETPELFDARGVLVYPHNSKYIVIGGNMRIAAARELKMTDVPCIVLPEGLSIQKLKELVIKDNGAFGGWEFSDLANEWDDNPLPDWGVPAWDTEEKNEGGSTVGEDDFDEEKDAIEVRCQKGDVWELGEHRLMCGDSIDLEQVKILMGGGRG